MKTTIIIFILLQIINFNLFAQKEIKFEIINKRYIPKEELEEDSAKIVNDIIEKAIGLKAIEFGFPNSITVFDIQSSVSIGNQVNNKSTYIFKKFMKSLFISDISTKYILTKKEVEYKSDFLYYNLEGVFFKNNKKRALNFKTDGLKQFYYNDDYFTFSFTPFSKGYLKVFIIDENENGIELYPNSQIDKKLDKNQTIFFPVERWNTQPFDNLTDSSLNHLVILFSKNSIPFNKMPCSFTSIFEWVVENENVSYFVFPFSITTNPNKIDTLELLRDKIDLQSEIIDNLAIENDKLNRNLEDTVVYYEEINNALNRQIIDTINYFKNIANHDDILKLEKEIQKLNDTIESYDNQILIVEELIISFFDDIIDFDESEKQYFTDKFKLDLKNNEIILPIYYTTDFIEEIFDEYNLGQQFTYSELKGNGDFSVWKLNFK